MATRAPTAGWLTERRFFGGMALGMIALVLLGFAPSFYLRGLVTSPRPNPALGPAVILHGLLFTWWMAIFWAQTALVVAGRRDLHVRLGASGMILAVLLVPLMYLVAVGQVAHASQPPFATPLGWTAVPLFLIVAYVPLVWLGWAHRRDAAAHKRLMLGATLLMMDPAIGRLPIVPPVLAGFAVLNLLAWSCFLPLLLWDRHRLGRIHWASALGAGLFAAVLVARLAALRSPAWETFAARLPGV